MKTIDKNSLIYLDLIAKAWNNRIYLNSEILCKKTKAFIVIDDVCEHEDDIFSGCALQVTKFDRKKTRKTITADRKVVKQAIMIELKNVNSKLLSSAIIPENHNEIIL